jgi:hypothetical protein
VGSLSCFGNIYYYYCGKNIQLIYMENNFEPLMGYITLVKEANITNGLIKDNKIARQIDVDGKTYNLACIIEIPLDRNMVGGVITKDIDDTFKPFVYGAIDELIHTGLRNVGHGPARFRLENALSANIQGKLNVNVGIGHEIGININTDRMCLNIYTVVAGPQHSHLSLWVNNTGNFQAEHQPAVPPRRENYIPGCTHYKLDIGGGGAGPGRGGNPADTVGFQWRINLDEDAGLVPEPTWYFSCTSVGNPLNGGLMASPFTQAVLDGLNEELRAVPVRFPHRIAANVNRILQPMLDEARAAAAAAAAPAVAPPAAAGAWGKGPTKTTGGKSLRKRIKKTRKTRKLKKSKKTRKHKRQ